MPPSPLPVIDVRHRRLLAVLIGIFGLALLLRLNGWSLPYWHHLVDQSPPTEILWGQARSIRSDDFLQDLGMTMAQAKHHPYFPFVNTNIGSWEFMAAPINVPAGVLVTLFRPFTWGFLIGPDIGLAWKWWGLALGLFYSWFLAFMLVSGNRFGLSVGASFVLLASPYVQFWSQHKMELPIHCAGALVAVACLLAARRRWTIWISGLFLGWSVAALALDQIYPPFAVTLGWLLVCAGGAWAWENRARLCWQEHRRHRLGAALAGLALAGIALGLFWLQSRDYLTLIRNTVYPGRRFSTGGQFPLWPFFSQDFFAQAWDAGRPWLSNICEGASFIFCFPAIWILTVAARRKVGAWAAILSAYIVVLLAYTYVGFPSWLAHATLFGMATSNRTQLGLGLADLMLLVAICANPGGQDSLSPRMRWAGVTLWLAILGGWALWFRQHWPDLGWSAVALGLGLQAILSYFFWIRRRPLAGLAVLGLASAVYTGGFNPWVRGGTDFVLHNPLSNEIRALDRADGSAHRWVVFGSLELSNLPRMIGVKSIGGYYGCPDFAMWDIFDSTGAYRTAYNQCAYATFQVGSDPTPSITSPAPDVFFIVANPQAPEFIQAGVRYFVVTDAAEIEYFAHSGAFRQVFSYAGHAIFERE